MLLILGVLALMLGTGGIYAEKQAAINNVDTGVVNIEISEFTLDESGKEIPWVDNVKVHPGKEVSKIPYFTATGIDCFIRAKIDIEEGIETNHPITLEDFKGISDDWVKVGDYFYYKNPLDTGESVDFFHSFVVPPEWDDSINPANVGNWGFNIKVSVDAVQMENFSPDFDSNSPWGDVVIKESIHKDGYDVNVFTSNKETTMSIVIVDNSDIIVKPDDFFEGFKTMVPGDVLTDSVDIVTDEKTKLYFTTTPLSDIELLKEMYLKIVLTRGSTEETIYEGSLNSDILNMFLGEFSKDVPGKLTFTVAMPKELDNEYTLRKASVKWLFDIESVEEDKGGNTGSNIGDSSDKTPSWVKSPKTGDDRMSMSVLAGIMFVSGTLLILLFFKKRRDSRR